MDLYDTGLLDVNNYRVEGTAPDTFPVSQLIIAPVVTATSLDLNFAAVKALDSRITFTRASSGTYIDSTGLVATASSGVARFTHDPVTLQSLGLLLEESRTNLFQRSEEFNDAYWTKTRCSISGTQVTAPDGATTADKLVEDTSTNSHEMNRGISVTSGQAYTFSMYIKPAGRSRISLELPFSFPAGAQAVYDVSTGTVVSTGASATASIVAQANGFYRCILTATANATATGTLYAKLVNTGTTTSYTGDGTSGLYLWGAQVEAGSFVTSYIATTSATVTRAADVASMTGSNFTAWYNQNEGSINADVTYPVAGVDTFTAQISEDGNNYLAIRRITGNNLNVAARDSSSVYDATGLSGTATVGRFVTAFAYSTNVGTSISVNGNTVATGSSFPGIAAVAFYIGGFAGGSSNQTVARIRYYPRRLTSSTLQQITK